MPPSRFLAQSSKWRNATATAAKPNERINAAALGANFAALSANDELLGQSTVLQCTPWPLTAGTEAQGEQDDQGDSEPFGYTPALFARASTAGHLVPLDLRPSSQQQPSSIAVFPSNLILSSFVIAPWWIASHAQDPEGGTYVVAASSLASQAVQLTRVRQGKALGSVVFDSGAGDGRLIAGGAVGITSLAWHPTVPGILAASHRDTVQLWNTSGISQSTQPSVTLGSDESGGSVVRHAAWTGQSANMMGTTRADGTLSLWDARAPGKAVGSVRLLHSAFFSNQH